MLSIVITEDKPKKAGRVPFSVTASLSGLDGNAMHPGTEVDLNAVAQDKPAPNLNEEFFAASDTNPAPLTPVRSATSKPSTPVKRRHRPPMLCVPM